MDGRDVFVHSFRGCPPCRAIPLMYVVPAKKEEHDKDAKGDEEDAKDEGEPDMATRVGDAVRDAKVALLKVGSKRSSNSRRNSLLFKHVVAHLAMGMCDLLRGPRGRRSQCV